MANNKLGKSYEYNVICDVCGFKYKNYELHKRWDGLMVCKHDFEHRHPSDFYRPRNDTHKLPYLRPDDRTKDSVYSVFGEPYGITVSTVSGTGNSGTKFTVGTAGKILGVKFYIGSATEDLKHAWYNHNPMIITLYLSGSSELKTQTFFGPFTTGWNTRTFDTPVTVSATTYTIARFRTGVRTFIVNPIPSLSAQPNLTFVASVFNVSSSRSEPTTSDASNLTLVDVVFKPD